jgi:hypothetical protein
LNCSLSNDEERSDVLKRVLMTTALLCACSVPVLADSTVKSPPAEKKASKIAPADVYFGRLKMSILGIANTIKDMRLRVDSDAEKSESIFGSLANCEEALRDWERKYPNDSWIPKNLFNLEVAYLHAKGERARAMAAKAEAWLRRNYPKSTYTAQAHAELVKAVAAAPVAAPAAESAPASDGH